MKAEKPDKVVLAAQWFGYPWPDIRRTVSALRAIGVDDIDLIGPVPFWNDGLPREVYQNFTKSRSVPTRISSGLHEENFRLDSELRRLSEELQIRYLSPLKILCSDQGCLTRVGDTVDSLTAWDNAHLTKQGSIYLVDRFPRHE